MLINSKESGRGDEIKKEKNGRPERNLLHCGFFGRRPWFIHGFMPTTLKS
jgi:hypothetical protein